MRDSRAMDGYRAWDSPIPERWTATARGILPFPSGGPLPRVGFSDSRAVDGYRARDSAIPERWNFLRVGFPDFWAMERYRAWDSVIPERWTITAREIRRLLSGGRLSRVRFSDF